VRGFTLLEMLLVLVILGMAAAVVAPPLARTVDRMREATSRDDVARAVSRLPLEARRQGRALHWSAGETISAPAAGTTWPAGWQVVALADLRIEGSGFCSGGEVVVVGPSSRSRWTLDAPDCRPMNSDAP